MKNAMTLEQGRDALRFCDSYSRVPTLLGISPFGSVGRMSLTDWRTLLGEEWQSCDNIGIYRKDLKLCMFLTATPHTCPEMMTADEQQALDVLPERVTIYRGCGPSNMVGCCWSLDRDVAAGFPLRNRYKQREPLLVTATVRRDRIVAVKLERDEREVITFNAHRVQVDPLSTAEQQRLHDQIVRQNRQQLSEIIAQANQE